MSAADMSQLGGPARQVLLALLPKDDWSQSFIPELDAELERLLAHGVVQRPRWWYAKQLLSPQTLLFLASVRRRARRNGGAAGRRLDLGFSSLDFKLGLRMLARFPGLTIVAGLAIAFAVALGAGAFEFTRDFFYPTMPFEGGDRVVELRNRELRTGQPDPRALHDFLAWREGLATVEELGAFQVFSRSLITARGNSGPVLGAALTANAFGIARTAPLLGRPIQEGDERLGAANVVVIGYDVWRSRFAGDPRIVGQSVRLGSDRATVVGVMPEGFGWPRAFAVWTPLRLNVLDYERGKSPEIQIVGRLASGVSIDDARAELATLGEASAADYPDTHSTLAPEISSYGALELDLTGDGHKVGFFSLNAVLFFGLIVLVAGNVALLLFARTTSRHGEIAVRSALGATRGRIVSQLFAEAMVLGGLAGVIGLIGADRALSRIIGVLEKVAADEIGYWFDGHLETSTIVYAMFFTLLAAVIAGVLPALKVTGRGVHGQLQQVSAGGPSREAGRLWSAIVVGQIGVTVAFVPIVVVLGAWSAYMNNPPYGFAADQFLMAELRTGGTAGGLAEPTGGLNGEGYSEAYEEAYQELKRRVRLEPSVTAVTVAQQVPGPGHPRVFVQVEDLAVEPRSFRGHRAYRVAVDTDFLGSLGATFAAGRDFTPADEQVGHHVAIVSETFVRVILEDGNAIGRRIRISPNGGLGDTAEEVPWYEIVGVVHDIPMFISPERPTWLPGIYVPLANAKVYPVRLAIRIGAEPLDFAPRLRALGTSIDPDLVLADVRPLDESTWQMSMSYSAWFWIVVGLGGMGILLSTTAIFAIMSFTVSRRTRELGVRVALGANRGRIVWTVSRRAFAQIVWGVLLGGALIVLCMLAVMPVIWPLPPTARDYVIVAAYLVIMGFVCALACIVPTSRALSVQPIDALRTEA